MLTASLQSTWETQKNRQSKQKYGSNNYQNAYSGGGEDSYGQKGGGYGQQQQQGQSYYPNPGSQQHHSVLMNNAQNSVGNNHSEQLPNLKMSQVMIKSYKSDRCKLSQPFLFA
jgi:hypothetical protein